MRKRLGFLGLAAALLCGTTAFAQDYNEAPILADQVAGGTLPALGERLPQSPFVLTPIESVGKYGGTWNSALLNQDVGWLRRTVHYEPLVAYSLDWSTVIANVAESWTSNAEATEYEFKLRAGHKWSDGQPFTAEDVVFAIEDVLKNPDYLGFKGTYDYSIMTVVAVDPQTVKITLSQPHGLLLEQFASVESKFLTAFPKHYCSQFMPKYNEGAADLAKSLGFDTWNVALEQRCDENIARNIDLPTLNSFRITAPMDGTNQLVTFERNAYYYKVDTAGNQLPYFDAISMPVVTSPEDLVLRALNGQYDFGNRQLATNANKPIFFENQEKGGYHLYDTVDARANTAALHLNLTVQDEGKRALYNELDFRKALSHAINREEIIDVVFAGQGEPWQVAPRPESRFFNETLAKQYTDYDPDLANALLDGVGLTERNADGTRLMADGRPLRIELNVIADDPVFNDVAQLVNEYWADIGVDLDARVVDRSFAYTTFQSNMHELHMWWGGGGMSDALFDSAMFFPSFAEAAYAIPWAFYYMDPKNPLAQTPPDYVLKQFDLYSQVKSTPDPAEQDRLFGELLKITQEQFYSIGISLPAKGYGIARNDIGNVPQDQPHTWVYPNPGPMFVAQLYRK